MVFGTCGKIFVFFSALWFYYLWVIPSIFSPYEFETEIEGLRSMKKPYPSSYRKPHFVRTMPTKRAVVVTIWSNDFVLPALVLFRSLRLYGTYLDLVLLVPSTHVGTESLPKHFRAPELAQSNLDAFKPLGVIIKRFDPSEMYREMSLSNKVWSFQFYKLYAWTLLEYERVLMLDADTLAVTNIDDVFDACPRNMVCGTKNPGRIPTSKLQARIGMKNYINGGFIILSPDRQMFVDMLISVKMSNTCCHWAFEQDFFNWYFWIYKIREQQMIHILRSGHYNTYPASHLIHFVKGKPWFWWAYPIPVLGAPIGHVWAAAEGVSSLQWVYIRGTLVAGFFGGIGTRSFLSLTLFPVVSTAYMLLSNHKHDPAVIAVRREVAHGAARLNFNSAEKKYFINFVVCSLIKWIMVFACVGRDCYIKFNLIPSRLQPGLAWIVISLLSSTTSMFSLYISKPYFDECKVNYVDQIMKSKLYSLAYFVGMFFSVIIGVSCISVVRFFCYNIRGPIVWSMFLIFDAICGRCMLTILTRLQNAGDTLAAMHLPKYA